MSPVAHQTRVLVLTLLFIVVEWAVLGAINAERMPQ